jgi:hypothetical protein
MEEIKIVRTFVYDTNARLFVDVIYENREFFNNTKMQGPYFQIRSVVPKWESGVMILSEFQALRLMLNDLNGLSEIRDISNG